MLYLVLKYKAIILYQNDHFFDQIQITYSKMGSENN